jgi:hypothetical protein
MSVSTAIRWRRRLLYRIDGAPEPSGMRAGPGAAARERCHELNADIPGSTTCSRLLSPA